MNEEREEGEVKGSGKGKEIGSLERNINCKVKRAFVAIVQTNREGNGRL